MEGERDAVGVGDERGMYMHCAPASEVFNLEPWDGRCTNVFLQLFECFGCCFPS